MESEYRKIYGNRRRPDARAHATIPLTTPPAEVAVALPTSPTTHKTIKIIRLVPCTPKPHDWGSWQVKTHHTSSTLNTPHTTQKEEELDKEEEEGELVYKPHSPYYSPVHPTEFMRMNCCIMPLCYKGKIELCNDRWSIIYNSSNNL